MGNAPRRSSLRPIALLISAGAAFAFAATASASLPAGRVPRPALVAPADGATVPEGGLQFAWQASPAAKRHFLLLSREPFDPSSLRSLPTTGGIEAHEVQRPIAALEGLGIRLDRDTRYYWAAAGIDPGNGRLEVSELRSCTVVRRFSNRVEPSPYLEARPVARAAPEDAEPSGPRRIRLRAGFEIDPTAGPALVPEALRAPVGPVAGRRTVLAYFGDEDPDVARERILEAGGWIAGYIPDRTFVVRLGNGTPNALEGVVAWSDAYHPAYKLSPRLEVESAAPRIVNLRVFADGDLDAVAAAVAAKGGVVRQRSDNGINKILQVSIPGPSVPALALESDVAWIEPHVPFEFANSNAQWVTQTGVTNSVRLHDLGLRGEGQVIMTSDSGVNVGHDQFRDPAVPITTFGEYPTHRKLIAYQKGGPSSLITFGDLLRDAYHGTHTACTAIGLDDPVATTNSARDGMAKAAKLWFMDLAGPTLDGLDVFLDLNDLFQPSYTGNAGGQARISSNSWGAPVNGDYDLSGLTADQFVWNHPDYLICFATGNSSNPGSVGTPATAKNVVSVGGTQNGAFANNIYTGTSRGPAADGRRKPVVAAPGQNVFSAQLAPSSYGQLSGTSMASPGVAGTAAMLRQYLTEGWYPTGAKVPANGFTPSAALLKAMLVNSAANAVTGFVAPDSNIGYGRIIADDVLYFAGDARRLLLVDQTAGLGNQEYIDFQVNVTNPAVPLEVTLCWNDYPGDPAGTSQIRNDLNLTATNGVLTYRGNSYTGGSSNTNNVVDAVNVEEAVLVPAPSAGLWTIRVHGAFVPFGPQPFALCITGGVGTDAGSIALDRASYGSTSTVEIEVTDTNAGGSVNVHVASTTEPAGETVTLTPAAGRLAGTIALSPSIGNPNDGTLQVSNGDVITATYTDASPAATLTARASVVIGQPMIAEVEAESQGAGIALVSWETDLNATSRVYYGLTPALGSATALDPLLATQHRVSITGLTQGATYYYDVESIDVDGSVTRDDNGGRHYRFTVREPGDLLLVYGGDLFEYEDRYAAALDSLGWSYDIWRGPTSETPVVGSLAGGLRSYLAVWWQVGIEYYPPFSDLARDSITAYLGGGGRLGVVGHDIAWALGDGTSPYYSVARDAWLQSTLRTVWINDPPTWPQVLGVAGDSISGDYAGGVPYEETRVGASGDEIDLLPGTGTITESWRSGDGTPDECGFRWESAGPLGTPGSGVWGGNRTRLASLYFEWSRIDPLAAVSNRREDILDKALAWLLGRRKPEVRLLEPSGTITADATDITWNETVYGGPVASRRLEYSTDGGQSWTLITPSAGPSPYSWDLTGVPNASQARVRIRVQDSGVPALAAIDQSDASFALQRAAGDLIGPAVRAGSMQVDPNPIDNQQPTLLTAVVSDSASGGSTVTAAEWSHGPSPAPAGGGTPITDGLGSVTSRVSVTIPAAALPAGTQRLHVRGRDQAGHWGPASPIDVIVNDPATSALLSLFEAEALAEGVEVRWRFSRPTDFETIGVERADGLAGPWAVLPGTPTTRGDVNVFLDATAEPGRTYAYRVVVRTGPAETQTFGPIWATAGSAVGQFAIGAISPNPTRGPARIDFSVAREVRVRLEVLDLQGREVATLIDRPLSPGRFQAVWNGTDGARPVSSGVYFVRMEWPGQSAVRRVVVTH